MAAMEEVAEPDSGAVLVRGILAAAAFGAGMSLGGGALVYLAALLAAVVGWSALYSP